jgi:hypothetical protein
VSRLAATAPVGAVLLGLLAVAWFYPPVAIGVVWPFLFLVPGWVLVTWARPRIGSTGRLGLAIVLSVAVSAHAVYWLSLATGGYRRITIFATVALLAVPLLVAAWRAGSLHGVGRSLHAGSRGSLRAVARNRGAFALSVLTGAFVAAVLASGLWHVTAQGVDSGGSNWSDLGVHLSIAQSLNAGNFPPQVPYFAGAPLVYHWFSDFHAAIAASAAGLFAIPAFIVSSAILAAALALLVHGFARFLLRGAGARRAALLAAVLAVFAGGMGYIRLIGDLANGQGNLMTLVTQNSYDNQWLTNWPYFRIPSVMGTGILVHRATVAGLPIFVGALLLLVAGLPTAGRLRRGWRDRPRLIILAGLLGALLAPFHFFFFPAVPLLVFLYVLLGGRLFERAAAGNAVRFLAPYVLSLPFAIAPLLQASGSGALQLVPGWESAPLADGPAAVAFFYATNLGVPMLLAIVALLAPRTPRRWFLGAWVLALFVVPNVVQVSAISFDMNKYFQAMWIAVAILAAWLIQRWPVPAIAAVLLVSVPSPLLVSAWTAFNREQVLSADELRAADWLAANTPDRTVVATSGWLNAPTDPAGRLRLLTFTPYVANLGYDPAERAADVETIFCGGDPAASAATMERLGATYLLEGPLPDPCPAPVEFATAPQFTGAFHSGQVTIYRLVPGAARAP